MPKVPADNPMSEVKVSLGRHLFYDTRLSGNGSFACASCHRQALAFTDGRPTGLGSTGESHPRGSMGLTNVAYASALAWANPNLRRLEDQALRPMFGDAPVELGLAGREREMLERLRADPRYRRMFTAGFPGEADPFTVDNVTKALAAFERTLISGDSPYDRYRWRGQASAISEAAKRGEALFFSERLACAQCHGGFNFTSAVEYEGTGAPEQEFFNIGLYNIGGTGAYPAPNTGVHAVTGVPQDMGRFKPLSLRNVALTAPYMHDGSVATLEDVIVLYEAGGRTIDSGPRAGIGRENPFKDARVSGFALSSGEREDLLAFLRSLTDSSFIRDPRFSDPWPDTLAVSAAHPADGVSDR